MNPNMIRRHLALYAASPNSPAPQWATLQPVERRLRAAGPDDESDEDEDLDDDEEEDEDEDFDDEDEDAGDDDEDEAEAAPAGGD